MKIRFGPSGNSQSFYDQGYTSTKQAPKWLYEMGLDAFEYSFGKGVRISEPTANEIGSVMAEYGMALSLHAPYYINFATLEEDKEKNNYRYILESARAAKWMGAARIIFHPGSASGQDREQTVKLAIERIGIALAKMEDGGYGDIAICPETMGKPSQLGSLDETMEICESHEKLIPCIDFGHLHARDHGAMKSEADYSNILDTMEKRLGRERISNFHIHFSRIQYTDAGEKRHMNFIDEGYGPDFEPLARQLKNRGLCPTVICESSGNMAEDAMQMKKIYGLV